MGQEPKGLETVEYIYGKGLLAMATPSARPLLLPFQWHRQHGGDYGYESCGGEFIRL
jgi:hypothetical protein